MELKQVRPINEHRISAIRWNREHKQEILDWLSDNQIMFTHHEINSAGELIVYEQGDRHPVMVYEGYWILKLGDKLVQVVTNEIFQEEYTEAE